MLPTLPAAAGAPESKWTTAAIRLSAMHVAFLGIVAAAGHLSDSHYRDLGNRRFGFTAGVVVVAAALSTSDREPASADCSHSIA